MTPRTGPHAYGPERPPDTTVLRLLPHPTLFSLFAKTDRILTRMSHELALQKGSSGGGGGPEGNGRPTRKTQLIEESLMSEFYAESDPRYEALLGHLKDVSDHPHDIGAHKSPGSAGSWLKFKRMTLGTARSASTELTESIQHVENLRNRPHRLNGNSPLSSQVVATDVNVCGRWASQSDPSRGTGPRSANRSDDHRRDFVGLGDDCNHATVEGPGGGPGVVREDPRSDQSAEDDGPLQWVAADTCHVPVEAVQKTRCPSPPPREPFQDSTAIAAWCDPPERWPPTADWNALPNTWSDRPATARPEPLPHALPVRISPVAIAQFRELAQPNTSNNVETCGLLLGRAIAASLSPPGYEVTHILLPPQLATPDICEMTDERCVFEYQIRLGLITLGWIHTHPRQSCFLSSIDCHTQFAYQALLPSAIAVVIAPTDISGVGIFQLTAHGMATIKACPQAHDRFHPHAHGPMPIYERCGLPDGPPPFEGVAVVDLRSAASNDSN